MREFYDEEVTLYRIPDLFDPEGSRGRVGRWRHLPSTGHQQAPFYKWRAKYGGMEVAELKRLEELEDENARLKRMFADLSLEHRGLKDVEEKNCNRSASASAGPLGYRAIWYV